MPYLVAGLRHACRVAPPRRARARAARAVHLAAGEAARLRQAQALIIPYTILGFNSIFDNR